jgi:hypothetical protein
MHQGYEKEDVKRIIEHLEKRNHPDDPELIKQLKDVHYPNH